ncbi:Ca2+-dependent phosphoinositide-specific phospholipase C [Streptomyces sp. NPDC002004]
MPVRHAVLSRLLHRTRILGTALLLTAAVPLLSSAPVHALPNGTGGGFDETRLDHIAVPGLHNAYEPSKSNRLTKELDQGAHLVELDVYSTYRRDGGWIVSHADPLFNENNCTYTLGSGSLSRTLRNGSLRNCLENLRDWSDSHPGHDPIYVKLELKWGFRSNAGMGPAELDHVIGKYLGADKVFRPSDMLDGRYPNLDAAAKADAWPTWSQLRGKFILYPITGTIENRLADYRLDNLSTAQEYAEHVRDLAAQGKIGQAMMWPDTHPGAGGGDPRDIYDPSLRPWFVMFDSDASTWLGLDMSWYCANHYLTTQTAAENVAPALDDTDPDPAAATERVRYLAEENHSSATTFDWMGVPGAFTVWPRNC